MIKYLIKRLKLPLELTNYIYSYLDIYIEIKKEKRFRFKRLIHNDFHIIDHDSQYFKTCYLKHEEKSLEILLKNNAYDIINNIHMYNINNLQ